MRRSGSNGRSVVPSPTHRTGHSALILYEYPLNERIRTLLRLEDLFSKLDHFSSQLEAPSHHVALATLFEILDITSRNELKSDLLQELERQKQALLAFRDNPDVSASALQEVLGTLDATMQKFANANGRSGQHLRDNEWLMGIRGRTSIAGASCEFDLPSYHAWLNLPADSRLRDIANWSDPFRPLRDSITMVLRVLRDSRRQSRENSHKGAFQLTLGGRAHQMVQVRLAPELGAVPEISANKHMLWIRFMTQGVEQRSRPYEGEVQFELALCSL
jgi:cell division protein ZapD